LLEEAMLMIGVELWEMLGSGAIELRMRVEARRP